MKNTKNKIITAILVVLLTTSATLVILSNSTETIVKASVPSDMLQYEWTQPAADCYRSLYNNGPAPNAPNIKWKAKIPGVSGNPVAFNGLLFVQALGITYALDGWTGETVWTAQLSGTIAKIDDTYMIVGNKGVKISDGSVAWTGPTGFTYAQSKINGVGYLPELKMIVDQNYGWSLADPSQPPTLVWNRTDVNYRYLAPFAYGDGKILLGDYHECLAECVDALTGETLWISPSTGSFTYGATYIDGKFIHGALDNNMLAWAADTGELLWTYNPGTWYGMWASSAGSAYGMVYEKNQDTYLYAIDATTGEMVWRAKGPGIGYSNLLLIADGKVYAQMGENQYRDFNTGEYAYSEYNCYDAYTGELIWSLPMEDGAPFNAECIAYGNLYVLPQNPTPQEPGVWTYSGGGSLGEVWCISSETTDWSMYLADPEHSSQGAGPTNLELRWTFEGDAAIQSSATIVNGVCYFGTTLGTIYAVNAETGNEIWSTTAGTWVKSALAVVNDKIYTGADDGYIYCLDAASGTELWNSFTGGITKNYLRDRRDYVRASPIIYENKVYAGALDGNLYCLNANTGSVIWTFQAGGPIFAAPTIIDNAIYIPASTPTPNGTLYKLDLSGNIIWQKEIPYVLDKTPGDGFYLLTAATVADGMVFLRNALRLNYALNATTGDIIWTYDGRYNPGTPFQSGGVHQVMPMLYKYGRVYFNDFYGITCLDATNGTEIWHSYLSRESLANGITYSYNRIYTVTEFGVLFVLDALTGNKLSYYEFTPASQLRSMPVPYNGNLYQGTNHWKLYCFGEARLMSNEPAQAASISSEMIMSNPAESTEMAFITTETTIIAVVLVAIITSITVFLALRKRK